MKRLDEKKSIERNELAAGASGTPIGASPGLLGGSVHGMMAAKAKSSPFDGPAAANQLQQQNLAQQNILQESPRHCGRCGEQAGDDTRCASDRRHKPSPCRRRGWSRRQSLLWPHHPRLPSVPLSNLKYDGLGKAQKIILPSGLGVLSMASEASRSIALDTAGTMFLSEDERQTLAADSNPVDRTCHSRSYPAGRDASRCLAAPQTTAV